MAFGKKTGGRQKGTPNHVTTGARKLILSFLERRQPDEIDALWEAAKAESASGAFKTWMQAQEFVLPKLGRTEVTGEDGGAIHIEIRKYDPNTMTVNVPAPDKE